MTPGEDGWISLFNGKDLAGWKVPNFGGEADVTVEDGIMTIGRADYGDRLDEGRTLETLGLTGVTKEELLAYIKGN